MNSIVDANYRSAFDTGSGYVTFELVIGDTTYTQDQFTSLHIDMKLFEEYGIGCVNLRTITATVADLVSVGLDVKLYATYHLQDGAAYSMLHSTGVVFRSERKNGQSNILCYDRLCLTEYVFKRTPTWQERDFQTVVQEIASDIEVDIADGVLGLIQPWALPDPGAMTAREILVEIAKSCAGNFFINSDGELDFLSVAGDNLSDYQIVTVDSNGLFQIVDYADLTDTTNVVILTEGLFEVVAFSETDESTIFWGQDASGYSYAVSASPMPAEIELTKKNTEFDTAEHQNTYEPYVAVILSNDASSWYSPSGLSDAQWEALVATGRTLNVTVEYGSQDIADYIYSKITCGGQFTPYHLTGNIDPASQIGDRVLVEDFNDGKTYMVAGWSLDAAQGRLFGEVGADGESEIETLQPYVPKAERLVRREAVERKAEIAVTQDSITSEVSRATAAEGHLSTLIEQTAEGLLITFTEGIAATAETAEQNLTAYSDEVQKYIRFAAGLIELGEKDAQIRAVLQSTKLSFYGENGQEAAWISNNQLFINEAVVNGKLTLQDITQTHKWVQTVNSSDGHFSGQYVG